MERNFKETVKDIAATALHGVAGGLIAAADWIEMNPGAAKLGIMIGGTLIGLGASRAKKTHDRNVRLKQEHRLYYDYKKRLWVELRRPARPWEREVIKQRIREGDSLYDIYFDLGLVK